MARQSDKNWGTNSVTEIIKTTSVTYLQFEVAVVAIMN
jgi:hypothetical protein